MAGLEVQIGADTSDLTKKIKEAELALKELSQVKLDRIKLGLDTKEIDGNIKSVKKSLVDLKTVNRDTGNSFSAMSPKIANGSNSLMQFSRIAQDAPFGIMGIGNNITATAESFGHLVKETGSAGGALKAVASSMLGTGGILLAVSLVTSGLTYMSQNGITVGDVFSKLAGTFDENAQSLNKMNAEAAKSAAGGIAEMNAYVSTAKNVNLSMSDRLIAVRKLQEEYPAYFGNLSKETILNGNVTGAVKEVTAALIAKARAAAYTGRITDLALEEFNLRTKEEQVLKDIAKQHKEIAIAKASANGFGGNASNMAIGASNDALRSQQSLLKETQSALRANWMERDKLTQKINENVSAQIKLETKLEKAVKAPKAKEEKRKKKSFDGGFIGGGIVNPNLNSGANSNLLGLNIVPDILPEITQKTKDIENALISFNENVNTLIGTTISSTFMNLGQVIGEAMANGGDVLSAAGNSLLQSIGGLLSAMGSELIKLGTAAVLAGTVTKTFGSIVGIGAGLLAIAGGTALSAVGSAMASKANKKVSGFNGQSGSVSTGASYSSPASSGSYSSSGGGFGGTVVFEISGTSLIGVLNNSLDRNKRLGN
jgi:hypothetical protein